MLYELFLTAGQLPANEQAPFARENHQSNEYVKPSSSMFGLDSSIDKITSPHQFIADLFAKLEPARAHFAFTIGQQVNRSNLSAELVTGYIERVNTVEQTIALKSCSPIYPAEVFHHCFDAPKYNNNGEQLRVKKHLGNDHSYHQ